jgi:ribosomal protein S18 acetylase RimI-like enzyme
MQYAGRSLTYAANYPAAENWIILDSDGTPIGRHLIDRTPYGYRCVDIAILPTHQRSGLGTAALRLLQQQTAALQPPAECHLQVNKDNPALRLYLRLGFLPFAEDELSYEMKWSAPAPAAR